MDWTNKVYEELSEFEKYKADKLIEKGLDSAHNYKGEPLNPHDILVIRDHLRSNLELLNRSKEQFKGYKGK